MSLASNSQATSFPSQPSYPFGSTLLSPMWIDSPVAMMPPSAGQELPTGLPTASRVSHPASSPSRSHSEFTRVDPLALDQTPPVDRQPVEHVPIREPAVPLI